MTVAGGFQLLSADAENRLTGELLHWELAEDLAVEENTAVGAQCRLSGHPRMSPREVRADAQLYAACIGETKIPMVTGLELGEEIPPDPDRPSLILRRAGHKGLWELAKETGTTPEAIWAANSLTEDPDPDRLLLIPVP